MALGFLGSMAGKLGQGASKMGKAMTGAGPGVNTGPSGSMMSRFGQGAAGAANALGQKYGGNLSGAAKSSSSLLRMQNPPMKRPGVISGMAGQMPGQQMPMPQNPMVPPMQANPLQQVQGGGLQANPEMQAQMPSAINTGPSPQMFQQPYQNLFSPQNGNTGITGGMFGRYGGMQQGGGYRL